MCNRKDFYPGLRVSGNKDRLNRCGVTDSEVNTLSFPVKYGSSFPGHSSAVTVFSLKWVLNRKKCNVAFGFESKSKTTAQLRFPTTFWEESPDKKSLTCW
jgi:hypothetical protein